MMEMILTLRRQNRSGVEILREKKFHMPTAYAILFLLLILVAIATWIIPAGSYDYVDGVPVSGTYHPVEQNPQGVEMCIRDSSEAVAAQIDQEVQRLVAEAYDRCEEILRANRDKLETVAAYLLEHETMDQEAFLAVFGEKPALSLKKEAT